MPRFTTPRSLDIALGAALVAGVILAVWPTPPAPQINRDTARAVRPPEKPDTALSLPIVRPDTAPADRRLRKELERLASAQARHRRLRGWYSEAAEAIGYWPAALVTVAFEADSAHSNWSASAYDPHSRRQCAIKMGPVLYPPFNPLVDGVIACRTLPITAESSSWGSSPTTTVWADGIGHAQRSGPEVLQRLRSMQLAWRGGGGAFGRMFARLRNGQARVPYPDEPGPDWASSGESIWLADATWGDLDGDGRWEALIRLVENAGGSSINNLLGLVRQRGGRLVNGPLVYIGDRTILLGLRAGGGTVTVDLVVQGENDGRCCPTDTVKVRYTIAGNSLKEAGDSPVGVRTSFHSEPAAAAGTIWLASFGAGLGFNHGVRRAERAAASQ